MKKEITTLEARALIGLPSREQKINDLRIELTRRRAIYNLKQRKPLIVKIFEFFI